MAKYDLARTILGKDFITPGEVTRARPSILYTDDETHKLSESLPPLDVLEWCKDNGYAVMPAPPTAMSVLDLWEMKARHFYTKMGEWSADQKRAHEDRTSQGWLAIKKTPVSNSICKNWNEQNKLLSSVECVPNAAEMSWFITTYFEVHGVRLLRRVCVRTSSLDSGGQLVNICDFDSRGLCVDEWHDDGRDVYVGLSAARRFDL